MCDGCFNDVHRVTAGNSDVVLIRKFCPDVNVSIEFYNLDIICCLFVKEEKYVIFCFFVRLYNCCRNIHSALDITPQTKVNTLCRKKERKSREMMKDFRRPGMEISILVILQTRDISFDKGVLCSCFRYSKLLV